jgi:glycerol-1-phosphate dehydrogenase [NAD(P)+]
MADRPAIRERVPARAAELPSALALVRTDAELADAIARSLATLGVRRPQIAGGTTGRRLVAAALPESHPAGEADAVIAVGGGRTLDAAKASAFDRGLPLVAVPTQASHDGICSPVAVLDDRSESRGTRPPAAVVVPLHVIASAPRRSIVSGLADLAANLIAVADWRYAADAHGEPFDDYAALLARSAAELAVGRRAMFSSDRPFDMEDVELLVNGLVLSGLAMTLAGSSRPCSGPEHLISHAFDRLGLGHASHGEQVAVGSTLAVGLFPTSGLAPVRELLTRVGAPATPRELGITDGDARRALDTAAEVRPARHSLLTDTIAGDRDRISAIMREAWGT